MEDGNRVLGDDKSWTRFKPLSIQFLDPSSKLNEDSILDAHDLTQNSFLRRLISRLRPRSIPPSSGSSPPNEHTPAPSSKESDLQPTASSLSHSSAPEGSETQRARLSVFITMPSPCSVISKQDGDHRDRPKTPDPTTLPPLEIGSIDVWLRSNDSETHCYDGAGKEKEPEF
ncbi:hypothetical protein PQX77_006265 [Marasmius sp. AFHP31]|nr:hypothetical protein PQX77_006265 [Marasmius sp. AFHP31]